MTIRLLGAILAISVTASAGLAAPITIDFTTGFQPLPYQENGFDIEGGGPNGQTAVTDQVLNDTLFDVGETFTFARSGGGLFSVVSFQNYRYDSGHDLFEVLGFVGGIETENYGMIAQGGGEFLDTILLNNSALIDELRFVGTGVRGGSVAFDNFVFDIDRTAAVPLPASLPLLLAAMGGMAWTRRRRA